MENQSQKRPLRRKIKKKSFLQKNVKIIVGILIALFLGQSMRGCINSSSYERQLKNQDILNDSINITKDNKIDELDSTLDVKEDFIQYLEYELKVAGVKVQAANDRAKAVQSTAEKVKNNTTTTIKIEADTTRNRVTQIPDSLKNN